MVSNMVKRSRLSKLEGKSRFSTKKYHFSFEVDARYTDWIKSDLKTRFFAKKIKVKRL